MQIVGVVAAALVGYLVGTFPSADVVSRLATRGRVDLRTAGSGNPGGLNAMKEIGTAWGVVVILLDMLKGVVGALAGWAIGGESGAYAAATTSIAGHIFPVWTGFRGGKGVATSAGTCLAVFPAFFPVDAAVAALGAMSSRNPEQTIWANGVVWIAVALAWWLGGLPNAWGPAPSVGLVVFSALSVLMIVAKFRTSALAAQRAAHQEGLA